jgi:hypothetical protein
VLLWGTTSLVTLAVLVLGSALLAGAGGRRLLAGALPATTQGMGMMRPSVGAAMALGAAGRGSGGEGWTLLASGRLAVGRLIVGRLTAGSPTATQRRTATASNRLPRASPPTPRTTLVGTSSLD